MNIELKLAELVIKINNYPFEKISDNIQPFICEKTSKSHDFLYNVHFFNGIMKKQGKLIFQKSMREVYEYDDKYIIHLRYKVGDTDCSVCTVYDFNNRCCDMYISEKIFEFLHPDDIFLRCLDIDFMLIYFDRIIMHASVVKYKDEVILFAGPSGIGKSTQAELWKKYMNADILNGDRATVDASGKNIYVYGSPYAGSSNIYRNEGASVKSIVLLGQGDKNTIERLSGIQAYKEMFPRFSVARWNEKLSHASMDIISRVIEKVPVYKLVCLPYEDAVNLMHDTLYN